MKKFVVGVSAGDFVEAYEKSKCLNSEFLCVMCVLIGVNVELSLDVVFVILFMFVSLVVWGDVVEVMA